MSKGVAVMAILGAALVRDEVENPEYKNWSGFKANAWVKYETTTEAAGTKTKIEQTVKLVELSKEKAVVETAMVFGGNALAGQKRDVPAKVKTEGTGQAKDAPRPKEGEGEIEVGGKKVKCHWIESTVEAGGNKTTSKIWYSKDIPGGLAKMESKTTGQLSSSSTMIAKEWKSE